MSDSQATTSAVEKLSSVSIDIESMELLNWNTEIEKECDTSKIRLLTEA